ncbi:uncharacterized protein KY384_001075 [Bacidia gigantensis]|uniref:uncharacterized protein n=1 Tax=Bacidia gigantensis TaxID=2732470 RepID=UPI001D049A01|nr:uncharacterized protein KY384_001075 [Bacidia gigantensis]KAG8534231.1 hypothetical protein KY384_001075 [Bacidia gigantensis]
MLQYSTACIAILADPLKDIPLPSSFPALVEKAVGQAVRSVSVQKTMPVYSLLSGLGSDYLDSLPVNLLVQLQDGALSVLKSIDLEDHLANLLCLGILGKLANSASQANARPTTRERFQAARRFFAPERAPKILDMLVLQVLSICSKSSPSTSESDLESLELAIVITKTVEERERETWCNGDANKTGTASKAQRVYRKITKPDLDVGVRSKALDFVCILIGDQPLPKELITRFEEHLHPRQLVSLTPLSMSKAFGQVKECKVTDGIKAVLNLILKAPCNTLDSLVEMDCAINLAKALAINIDSNSLLLNAVIPQKPTDDFLHLLTGFITSAGDVGNEMARDGNGIACPVIVTETLTQLSESLRALFLRSSLLAGRAHRAIYLPFLGSLVELHRGQAIPRGRCEFCEGGLSVSKSVPPLYEVGSTPEARSVSHDWKKTLVKQLDADSDLQYKHIVRIVGDICCDLELRCNQVEGPLRAEQLRCNNLQKTIQDSSAKVQVLEKEVRNLSSAQEDSHAKAEDLADQLESSRTKVQDVLSKLQKQQEDFQRSESEARLVLEAAMESSRERDLVYFATLKGKDEKFENQLSELQSTQSMLAEARREIDNLEHRKHDDMEMLRGRDQAIKSLEEACVDAETTAETQKVAIHGLQDTKTELLREKEQEVFAAKAAAEHSANTIADLEDRLQSTENDICQLKEGFNTRNAAKDADHAKAKASFDAAICKLQDEVAQGVLRIIAAETAKDAATSKLEKRICIFRQDRDRRAREFAEAQDLSRRLMSVVGCGNPTAPKRAPQSPTLSFESESSSWSGAPTPKRSKTQLLSAIPGFFIEFGIMYSPTVMLRKKRYMQPADSPLKFGLNMRFEELKIDFELHEGRKSQEKPTSHKLRFTIPFRQMQSIQTLPAPDKQLKLLVSLDTPPKVFKKLDGIVVFDEKTRLWTERDMWFRQTDMVSDRGRQKLRRMPVSLTKSSPMLDLGRWTTYCLSFKMTAASEVQFGKMQEILQDFNIDLVNSPDLTIIDKLDRVPWNYTDPLESQIDSDPSLGQDQKTLPFKVLYQLEVCLSQGILDEHTLKPAFGRKLMSMKQLAAIELLELAAAQRKRIFDPMSIFDLEISAPGSSGHVPSYCVPVHSVVVTPTSLKFNTPTIETSNRILRQYPAYNHHFIRVRFTEESPGEKIYSTHKETQNEIFTRIKRTMSNGIKVGHRHYQFLAFGNSQFREHGAYFFAPTADLRLESIRGWMGHFDTIKSVALRASRWGQCFSTTRAVTTVAEPVEIFDIRRNGFLFTDGVGKISPFLADEAADELGISRKTEDTPSVFQIRFGGCKGVLVVWPELSGRQIHIRESQYKFAASSEQLEIIRWSQFASANLNRQIVLVLSALGVPDHVFVNRLQEQLRGIDDAMEDPDKAVAILQRDVDHNQMTLRLAGMIIDGFQHRREPFTMSLLRLWRAWSIKYLKEKARITISAGAHLFGCVDETAILRGHFDDGLRVPPDAPFHENGQHTPEVFIQLSKGPEGKPKVIVGPMVLARNPSLHPGDIRVVRGVDIPQLRHLKDCIVLPQTGHRDVASMCSGGDLDGDDFIAIWDSDLLPKEWNYEPMDYTAPPRSEKVGEITTDDLTTFFIQYIKNDSLPRIAHAHLAQADYCEDGVKNQKCLELASLHSMAVDYPKTGQPAIMTDDLIPRKWPHFMEKKKPPEKIYHSDKVLGQLYDQVERAGFEPAYSAPFDQRIIQAFKLSQQTLQDAASLKRQYDAQVQRIMAQHAVKSEFEVWSTFVMEHNNANDYKFHEEIGRVSSNLKEGFKDLCIQKAEGKQFEKLAPFVAAMYKVTADEVTSAVNQNMRNKRINGDDQPLKNFPVETMPLMSFPWIFHDILGKIGKSHPPDHLQVEKGTQLGEPCSLGASARVKVMEEKDARSDIDVSQSAQTLPQTMPRRAHSSEIESGRQNFSKPSLLSVEALSSEANQHSFMPAMQPQDHQPTGLGSLVGQSNLINTIASHHAGSAVRGKQRDDLQTDKDDKDDKSEEEVDLGLGQRMTLAEQITRFHERTMS